MKRDMDLVRAILLTIEESEKFPFYRDKNADLYRRLSDEYDGRQIRYHLTLLENGGLIRYSKTGYTYEAEIKDTGLVQEVEEEAISSLTWQGHEFLDAARDQKIWDRAKKVAQDKGGSLPFDVLKALLIQLTRQAVGL